MDGIWLIAFFWGEREGAALCGGPLEHTSVQSAKWQQDEQIVAGWLLGF